MKLTPTQVYNKLVHLQILAGSTMRQSNTSQLSTLGTITTTNLNF